MITQQANAVGDIMIVQGNASYFPLNGVLYANSYTQLTCDTAGVNNYLGSLSLGQTINYNGNSYPIIKIGTAVGAGPYVVPPNTATVIVVMGVVYSAQIPNNAIVYASNNTS